MGCLLAVFAGFFPRIALVGLWIFTNDVDRAYDSFIIPLLGLFFLPLTTLIYALVWAPGVGAEGIDWVWVAPGLRARSERLRQRRAGAQRQRD